MKTGEKGRELIKKFEGFYEKAYLCPGGKWTIGWGHTKNVKPDAVVTKEDAEKFLSEDLQDTEKAIEREVKVSLNQNQFDALVSLVFNIGEGNFRKSSLLMFLNEGEYAEASIRFLPWTYSNHKVLPGLLKRRTEEKALFLS